MPKAIFIIPNGRSVEVEVPVGMSLMKAATINEIAGIVGDCGGAMSCATCHVFVDEKYCDKLNGLTDMENDMLHHTVAPRQKGSRLSCQIVMSEDLDGIVLIVADPQV